MIERNSPSHPTNPPHTISRSRLPRREAEKGVLFSTTVTPRIDRERASIDRE
jgi:hypothetical protein